jgi:hypothetical protein
LPLGNSDRDVASEILDPGAFAASVIAIGRSLAAALGMPV